MTTDTAPRRCSVCGAPASDDAAFCESCGARMLGTPVAPTPPPPATGELADFWLRLAAYVLDWVIVAFSLPIMLSFWSGASVSVYALVVLLLPFLPSAYFWIGNSLGGTAGKRITGLAVIDETGHAPGLARGLVRYLVSLVSALALYLGYLWMIRDEKKQTWHDKAAGTYVVRRARRAVPVA